MDICRVIGNLWATQKSSELDGFKLMVVETNLGQTREQSVAVDLVGSGIGETVLVVHGSSARAATGREHAPIDAAIIGIVDRMGIKGEQI